MKKSAITLLSGGLDSAVATLLARENFNVALALTFDYGQRAAKKETQTASAFCDRYKIEHKTISLPWLEMISGSSLTDRNLTLPSFSADDFNDIKKQEKSAQAVWIPNRNALFANIAAAYAESKEYGIIVAGFNSEEAQTFPDNSANFVEAINTLFSFSTLSRPKLISPVQQMNKIDIVREAVRLELPPHFFWSCYEGGARMCGSCESCARTIRAFKKTLAWDMVANRFTP